MKKIIAMAIATICLVSATFALNFEIGARGILGYNMALNSDFKTEYSEATAGKVFDSGFGLYSNFALFNALGIQVEANYIQGSKDFNNKSTGETTPFAIRTLDLAPMVMLNLDLWKFTISLGAGPNFSIPITNTLTGDLKAAKSEDFKMGLIGGADFKFYITDHLGIVLSGRYIGEFNERKITVYNVETPYTEYIPSRKTVYGGLGVEWKVF